MSCLLAIAHLGLVFENNDLLALALSLDSGNHLRPWDQRGTHRHLISISDK